MTVAQPELGIEGRLFDFDNDEEAALAACAGLEGQATMEEKVLAVVKSFGFMY